MSANAVANSSCGVDGGCGARADGLRHRRQPLAGAGIHARQSHRADAARTAARCQPTGSRTTGFSIHCRVVPAPGTGLAAAARAARLGLERLRQGLLPPPANRWAPRPIASPSAAAPSSTGATPKPKTAAHPRPTSRSDGSAPLPAEWLKPCGWMFPAFSEG